jgi:hypothetical protein
MLLYQQPTLHNTQQQQNQTQVLHTSTLQLASLHTCVQQQQVSHHHLAVLDQAGIAPSHHLHLDYVLLGIQLAELQVLLEVVDGACGSEQQQEPHCNSVAIWVFLCAMSLRNCRSF